jgi:hypothetical protein
MTRRSLFGVFFAAILSRQTDVPQFEIEETDGIIRNITPELIRYYTKKNATTFHPHWEQYSGVGCSSNTRRIETENVSDSGREPLPVNHDRNESGDRGHYREVEESGRS